MPQNFKFIVLLGRPGCGKGTQAELLRKKFPFQHISTGHLLRKRAQKRDSIAKRLKKILNTGRLVPTLLVFQLWMPLLEKLRKQTKFKGVLFDGSPRKLFEALMLDEVLEFYGWDRNVRVLNIEISDEEAKKRLFKRGRADDTPRDIRTRLKEFREEVVPVLNYYRKRGVLVSVNGERPIEVVHQDILRKLRSFLRK